MPTPEKLKVNTDLQNPSALMNDEAFKKALLEAVQGKEADINSALSKSDALINFDVGNAKNLSELNSEQKVILGLKSQISSGTIDLEGQFKKEVALKDEKKQEIEHIKKLQEKTTIKSEKMTWTNANATLAKLDENVADSEAKKIITDNVNEAYAALLYLGDTDSVKKSGELKTLFESLSSDVTKNKDIVRKIQKLIGMSEQGSTAETRIDGAFGGGTLSRLIKFKEDIVKKAEDLRKQKAFHILQGAGVFKGVLLKDVTVTIENDGSVENDGLVKFKYGEERGSVDKNFKIGMAEVKGFSPDKPTDDYGYPIDANGKKKEKEKEKQKNVIVTNSTKQEKKESIPPQTAVEYFKINVVEELIIANEAVRDGEVLDYSDQKAKELVSLKKINADLKKLMETDDRTFKKTLEDKSKDIDAEIANLIKSDSELYKGLNDGRIKLKGELKLGNVSTDEEKKEKKKEKVVDDKEETEKDEEKKEEGLNLLDTKVDPYDQAEEPLYDLTGKKIENTNVHMRRAKVRKVLESIFDDEQSKEELKRNQFRVNLSSQDGLPALIRFAKENQKEAGVKDVFDKLSTDSKGLTKEELKKLLEVAKGKGMDYNKKGPLEFNRLVKILNRAKWEDLSTLDDITRVRQGGENIGRVVAEWNNELEVTGNIKDDKRMDDKEINKTLINTDNVLGHLCDFNVDGKVSIDGDQGTVFGNPLKFTIEQAIALKDLDQPGTGEQVVIKNILRNVRILGNDTQAMVDELERDFLTDGKEANCTKEKLAELVKKYPSIHINFSAAFERMNGGQKSKMTPDLKDNLMGKINVSEMNELSENLNHKIDEELKKLLDSLKDSKDENGQKLAKMIQDQGLIKVRKTIFAQFMEVVNNTQWQSNDSNQNTLLNSAGVTKLIEVQKKKNELLEKLTKNFVAIGIHGNRPELIKEGKVNLQLNLGYARARTSESGKRKGGFNAGGGLAFNGEGASLFVGVGGDIARQYNYKNVISSSLDDVASAKYVGLEGQAMWSQLFGPEASVGVQRQQDPEMAINQIEKQYLDVTDAMFSLGKDPSDVESFVAGNPSSQDLKGKFEENYKGLTNTELKGFAEKNKNHMNSDMEYILNFMETYKILDFTNGPLKESNNKGQALLDLLEILKDGNTTQRRTDLIRNLNGKISLTKLSFGFTSAAFSLSGGKSQTGRHQDSNTGINSSSGPGTGVGGTNVSDSGGMSFDGGNDKGPLPGEKRVSVFGMYIGGRISTWTNKYVTNAQQFLITQQDLGNGLSDEAEIDGSQESYAKYILAMFNKKGLTAKAEGGKIIIESKDKSISDIINVFCKKGDENVKKNFSLEGNKLIIGDVKELGVYTVVEAKGVRRILSLGTKILNDAEPVTNNKQENVGEIKSSEIDGYKDLDKMKIDGIVEGLARTSTGNVEWAADQKALIKGLFASDGTLKAPTANITYEPPLTAGTKFTTGTLIINKPSATENLYTVKYVADATAKEFNIKYTEKGKGSVTETFTENGLTDIFKFKEGEELYKVQSLMNGLENKLSDWEKKNKAEYVRFMTAAGNVISNGDNSLIDKAEYDEASKHLTALFGNDAELQPLVQYLAGDNYTNKAYIIDRLKSIFAKEARLQGKSVGGILKMEARKGVYDQVLSPSGARIPNSLKAVRESREASTKKFGTDVKSENHSNLIGYTAFYRRGRDIAGIEKDKDSRRTSNQRWSMTAPGDTNVLGDFIQNLDGDKRVDAKKWFIENLKINDLERKILSDSILKKIKEKNPTVNLTTEQVNTVLIDLLTKETENIVIGDGKDKVTINLTGKDGKIGVDYAFYLLGECVNESIGIQFNSINVTNGSEGYDVVYENKGKPDPFYKGGLDIGGKAHSIASVISADKKNIDYKHVKTVKVKDKSSKPADEHVDSDTDRDYNGGDDGTGDGGTNGETGGSVTPGTGNTVPSETGNNSSSGAGSGTTGQNGSNDGGGMGFGG